MTRGEFEQLVERYRVGKCTPEEVVFVERWMQINGDDDDDLLVFENELDATRIENEVWVGIQSEAGLVRKTVLRWNRRWFWESVASVLLLAVSFLLIWDYSSNTQGEQGFSGREISGGSEDNQRILLPDSSVVTLADGASIAVMDGYGRQSRTVRLKGEAFFEIKRNPKSPFLVYSGDLVTEVLGTSFTIKPELRAKTIEVSVSTGKVSVYSNEKDRNQRKKKG